MINWVDSILCRYNEIAIKGANRSRFEQRLMDNMRRMLKSGVEGLKIKRARGRIWVVKKDESPFEGEEIELIKREFPRLFGLESYSPGKLCDISIDSLKNAVKETAESVFKPVMDKVKYKPAFRVRTRRANKKFPMSSREVDIAVADVIGELFGEESLLVDLNNADLTVGCEIRDEFAFVYYETLRGPGGLPAGSNASVLSLLSGGIDSPAACYLTMKRGCEVDFLTFHSPPYTPPETIEKVREIVAILNKYQTPRPLLACDLSPIQKLIRDKCVERYRTVLFRRMMMRIAEKAARKRKREALLTGEAVGQVASQTITNMGTINAAIDMLVLRPLLGMDKLDVIEIARKIGTMDISERQVPDSCTVFAPRSPSTRVPVYRILAEEEKLGDYMPLLDEMVENIEIIEC